VTAPLDNIITRVSLINVKEFSRQTETKAV
jgi:hypothetical protein